MGSKRRNSFGRSVARLPRGLVLTKLTGSLVFGGGLGSTPRAGAVPAGHRYAIGTEFSANIGVLQTRNELGAIINCSGGFIYSGEWQGVEADTGWVEVGTAICKAGSSTPDWWSAASYAYLCNLSQTCYKESRLRTNVGQNSHNYKTVRSGLSGSSATYTVAIDNTDGRDWSNIDNFSTGDNTADVGMESDNTGAISSIITHQSLQNDIGSSWNSWSGQDDCTTDNTSSQKDKGRWQADDQWKLAQGDTVSLTDNCPD